MAGRGGGYYWFISEKKHTRREAVVCSATAVVQKKSTAAPLPTRPTKRAQILAPCRSGGNLAAAALRVVVFCLLCFVLFCFFPRRRGNEQRLQRLPRRDDAIVPRAVAAECHFVFVFCFLLCEGAAA